MIGYLIDPEARTVTAVEHGATLAEFYALLRCDSIEAVTLARPGTILGGLALYVDEEARLTRRATHEFAARFPERWTDRILGRGILVGFNDEGEETAPLITLDQAREWIHFL